MLLFLSDDIRDLFEDVDDNILSIESSSDNESEIYSDLIDELGILLNSQRNKNSVEMEENILKR